MEAERQGLEHPEVFADSTTAAAANGTTKALALTAAAAAADKGSNDGSSSSKDKDPAGQEVDLPFPAVMKDGVYNLQLVVMSDCWVGADEVMPVSRRGCLGTIGKVSGLTDGVKTL
jgi:hypothetical protein